MMTYAPRTFDPADDATELAGVTSVPITQYQKGPSAFPQYVSERFSGTVAISPPLADRDVKSCEHGKGRAD